MAVKTELPAAHRRRIVRCHASAGEGAMAWNFCAYCGSAVAWQVPEGQFERHRACSGCGRQLYRNPGVNVLCLVHQGSCGGVSFCLGTLADFETVQEASMRLLARYRLAAQDDADPRLFAVISDFDADRVYLVFRADVVDLVPAHADLCSGPWREQLADELQRELQSGRHRVHLGLVRNGQLQLTPAEPT